MSYYDKDGKPLELIELDKLLQDVNYKRIKETILEDGKWVSTVWLGIDHNFTGGTPLICETMVFPNRKDFNELDCNRYSTLSEALDGHEQMVKHWRDKHARWKN